MKDWITKLCIKWLERGLERPETLSEEQYIGLLSMLWSNPAFRKYVEERNKMIIYAIAGVAGTEPEPRDKTRQLYGQRVENLVLAAKVRTCATRVDKERKADALKKVPK